jgi:hypothetical protein
VDGWTQLVADAPFDHDKTDYALVGLHASVECRACHRSGSYQDPLTSDACTDCHDDHHRGQLADREDGGRCDACHDVNGFTPSLYDLVDHEDSGFPLLGSHRAVACNACHPKEDLGDSEAVRLEYDSFECRGCHGENMPPGHLADLEANIECETCHSSQGLAIMARNHDSGEFPLTGRHRDVPCSSCHAVTGAQTADEHRCYTHLSTACQRCHGDRHDGQFAEQGCESCHTAESWDPEAFDHQVASTYPLEGKHLEVACEACHPVNTGTGGESVRHFKPIDTACRSCHAASGLTLSPSERGFAQTGGARP